MGKTKTITFKNSMFEAESATKVRTKELIPVMSGRTLTFDKTDNTVIAVYEYDESRTLLGLASEFRTDRTCTLRWNTCYILIMIKMNDGSNVSPTEVESKIGGGLSMCERMIEFGTLADDSLFVKGRNLLPDTIITDEIVNKLSKTANITDFSRIQNLENNLGDYLYWKVPAGITVPQYVCGNIGNGTLTTSKTPSGRIVLVPDVTYVYSFWVEPSKSIPVNAGTTAHIQCTNIDGNPVGDTVHQETDISFNVSSAPADVWTKVVRKFKVKTPSVFRPFFLTDEPDLTMKIAQIKLEIGDEATDYSPAPEDFVNRTCADYDLTV